jgi:hypothetical protein
MLRSTAGGLGLLLIVAGGIFLGQGGGLIGGSFMTGRGLGGHRRRDDRVRHLLARRGQVSRLGSEAMTELDEIRLACPSPERVRSSKRSARAVRTLHGCGVPIALRHRIIRHSDVFWRCRARKEGRSIAGYTAGG